MARREIDRWTLWYWFLQTFWAGINFTLYYKRIGVFNKHKIPKDASLIIAPNHQNALMDAMAFVTRPGTQRVFLTRADVFNKPLVERLLYSWKMLPVFRIRDGRASLQKNEEIFDSAVKIIQNKKCPLFMFPEGNHGDKRRLRPLVKGIFRIAFMAQEKYKDKPGVKIVPAGLDYEHYQKYGKELLINYGDPIEVCEYWKKFEENPVSATNALRERLEEEMRKVMIDIKSEDYYDTIMHLRDIYRPTLIKKLGLNLKNQFDKFKVDKNLIEALSKVEENQPDKIKSIDDKTKQYVRLRNKVNLREWIFSGKKYTIVGAFLNILLSVVLLPVLLFGLLNNAPVFFIPGFYAKKIKDPQFRSTAAWGMALVLQFIYYPILIVLGFNVLPALWLKLLYIPILPFSGYAAWQVWKLFIKNWNKLRFVFMKSGNKNLKSALSLRQEIVNELNALI